MLYLTSKVLLRFHVSLASKAENNVTDIPNSFHTVYEVDSNKYINYDVRSFMTLDIKDNAWNKSKSILITPRNIFQLMTHLNKLIANIYKKDTFFYTSDNKLNVNKDKLKENIVHAYNLTGDQRLIMMPAVFYDVDDNEYEGALIIMNNDENQFIIPIDVLETFKYEISQVNFMLYTGTLMNHYFNTLYNKDETEEKVTAINKWKPSVFRDDSKTSNKIEEENTRSTISNDIKSPSQLLDI